MRTAPRWRRYLRFWRTDIGADVDDELQFHLQERIDDLIARGLPPAQAAERAMQSFGNLERVKATCRDIAADQETDMRRAELLSVLRQDAVFALRQMRSNRTVTAAIALTLALGIGATTAIFSVVNSVLLRPLPWDNSDRIVLLYEQLNGGNGSVSVGHLHDWMEQTRSFEAIAAYQGRTVNLTDGDPVRLSGMRATPSYFRVLSMPPAVGRYFNESETAESRVVVISYPLWISRFDGDPGVVGREITLNGERHTVVGVLPAASTLSEFSPQLVTPLSFTPDQRTNYGAHTYLVAALLKPGVTVAQANEDLARVTDDIRRRMPDEMKNRTATVQSLRDALIGDFDAQLWVLFGAVTFVLLIGCGNVANLLLARATARRREIAIRGALGGARSRLIRQLLTESVVLALAGGAAGVVLAHYAIRFLVTTGPQWLPRLRDASLDGAVLGFALALTVLCGLVFGVVPALRATRMDLQSELRQGGRGFGTVVRDRVRGMLIVTEIAVALVLLISAGLLLRSAERLQRVPSGFDPSGVTLMRIALPPDRYEQPAVIEQTYQRIVQEVRAIPGVTHAGAGTRVPMLGPSIDMGLHVDGADDPSDKLLIGHIRMVTDGYIETLGMRLKRGRLLEASDLRAGAPWVIVVNEAFARATFGTEDPLGKRISGWQRSPEPEWREIVGVVADVRSFGLENDAPPEMYMPMTQAPEGAWPAYQRSMMIVARSGGGAPIAGAMRNVMRRIDASVPLFDVQTMDNVLQNASSTRRFNTQLLAFLGLTGLILAAIGIYGVIAFFVTQRTHEIGVRVALGASRGRVVRMVVSQAVTLALIGVAIGGAAAYWATRFLETMLYQTGTRDPLAYAAAAGLLVLVAAVAAALPARRAARVDPVRALSSA